MTSPPRVDPRQRRRRGRLLALGLALVAVFSLAGLGLAGPVAGAFGALTGHRPVPLRLIGWLQGGLPLVVSTVAALRAPRRLARGPLAPVLIVLGTSLALYAPPGRASTDWSQQRQFGGHYLDGRQLAFGAGVGVLSAVVGFALMVLTVLALRRSREREALRRPSLYAFLLGPLAALVLVLFVGPA